MTTRWAVLRPIPGIASSGRGPRARLRGAARPAASPRRSRAPPSARFRRRRGAARRARAPPRSRSRTAEAHPRERGGRSRPSSPRRCARSREGSRRRGTLRRRRRSAPPWRSAPRPCRAAVRSRRPPTCEPPDRVRFDSRHLDSVTSTPYARARTTPAARPGAFSAPERAAAARVRGRSRPRARRRRGPAAEAPRGRGSPSPCSAPAPCLPDRSRKPTA